MEGRTNGAKDAVRRMWGGDVGHGLWVMDLCYEFRLKLM